MMNKDEGGIRSVAKALQILEAFDGEHRTLRVTDLARGLGLPKSTVHGLLRTLGARGFVRQVEGGRAYGPGPALLRLATMVDREVLLVEAARGPLRELARGTEETAKLGVRVGLSVVVLEAVESPRVLHTRGDVGVVAPLYCTALGKAVLAFLPKEERERIVGALTLRAYTPRTVGGGGGGGAGGGGGRVGAGATDAAAAAGGAGAAGRGGGGGDWAAAGGPRGGGEATGMREGLGGIIPPMVTPCDEAEDVDVGALQGEAEYLLSVGATGVVVGGSTGEGAGLLVEEVHRAVGAVVGQVGGRVPVIAGAVPDTTREALVLGRAAREAGADALQVTPPHYLFPPGPEEVVEYYRALGEGVGGGRGVGSRVGRGGTGGVGPWGGVMGRRGGGGVKQGGGDLHKLADLLD